MFNFGSITQGLTFDDVLLVPQYSPVRSRREVSTRTRVSRNIFLNIPIVASNMDTVCEEDMAVAIAREGGIGILHRFCSVEEQCRMIAQVKRAQSHHVDDPVSVGLNAKRDELVEAMNWSGRKGGVGSLMVLGADRTLLGVITRADLEMAGPNTTTKEMMTPRERLVTSTNPNLAVEECSALMLKHRISDLPIVDENFKLVSLMTAGDVRKLTKMRNANTDKLGRLRVGAAIGVKRGDIDRAVALVEAGADLIVVDIAHGHSALCVDMVKALKANAVTANIDVVAGNVATGEAAQALIDAGADGLKVGVGPGSICITRIVAGAGVPQLTAINEVFKVANPRGIPIIADGGVKSSGDISKAIGAGADTVMLGNMLAGTEESPGHVLVKDGRKVKVVRGMAGIGANVSKASREKSSEEADVFAALVPEGVEGVVPYKGAASVILRQLVGGLRSGMSYSGATTIEEMHKKAKFVRMSGAGLKESGFHDISKL
jgi:IMP dehydrogenase